MGRRFGTLIGLILSTILISGCSQTKEITSLTETPLPIKVATPTETSLPVETTMSTETQGWQIYRNDEYEFSLMYPSDWIIESESYQSIILVPPEETSWQPSTPADIPKDPAVRISSGEYIRGKLGSSHFPEVINSDTLKTWFAKMVSNGEALEFSERTVNDFSAFEITEIRIPGCEKVVYWRPVDLKSLVRISTGCESQYLDEFDQIVNSAQQTE